MKHNEKCFKLTGKTYSITSRNVTYILAQFQMQTFAESQCCITSAFPTALKILYESGNNLGNLMLQGRV